MITSDKQKPPCRQSAALCAGQLLAAALVLAGWCASASAAELRLRSEFACTGTLVRLGDVAEVHATGASEAAALAKVELFPAPAQGRSRFVHAREIQDTLVLRGLDLTQHRLSGSNRVKLTTAAPKKPAALPAVVKVAALAPLPRQATLSQLEQREAEETVRSAILGYLAEQASADESWQVDFDLPDETARKLRSATANARTASTSASTVRMTVSGGESPWVGSQQFVLHIAGAAESADVELAAEVSTVPMVVVAVRATQPGTLLQAADLQLAPQKPGAAGKTLFHQIEQVVGQETTRAVVAGQPLADDDVRAPILVRRGDAVTVYAGGGGVRVRTTARAQDQGSLGDIVPVESLLNRQRYFARVTGIQEVQAMTPAMEADFINRSQGRPAGALSTLPQRGNRTQVTPAVSGREVRQ